MNANETPRRLKVYQASSMHKSRVPQIRLQGEWLKLAGFDIGETITVDVSTGEIRITLADVVIESNKKDNK